MSNVKKVSTLVEKLDDFEITLRVFKTAKLHMAQNCLVREAKGSKFLQNSRNKQVFANKIVQEELKELLIQEL